MSDWQHPTQTTQHQVPYHDAPVSRRGDDGATYWCPRCECSVHTLPETHVEEAHDGQHLRTTIMLVVRRGTGHALAVNPLNDCGPSNHDWPADDAEERQSCTACDAVRNPPLSASTSTSTSTEADN
jgi:hypothetical protein